MFLRIFQHLLPRATAWRIIIGKQLRQFFEGLVNLPSDVRDFYDGIYNDVDPQLTRELPAWESQFGLPFISTLTEQQRRDRVAGAWAATGGQSPRYIQDTLQAAGFNVFLHEWWSDLIPTVRNPLLVLNDGTGLPGFVGDGVAAMNDGSGGAVDGASATPTGYALVNNIPSDNVVPNDPTKWPYFLYIGGEVYPNHATVPANRRSEFETLCLKICPAQQWLGVLVTYT